jgi:hypothetical protein
VEPVAQPAISVKEVGRFSLWLEGRGGEKMRKRITLLISALMLALSMSFGGMALADPDFGPGNSSKGPHDAGAKCHPPGQTVNTPGCK